MALAMKHAALPAELFDDKGGLRVIRDPVTFDGLMDSAFNDIRQNLAGKVPGLIRLLDTFDDLTAFVADAEHHDAILRHTENVERLIKASVDDPDDLADAARRLSDLRRHFGREAPAVCRVYRVAAGKAACRCCPDTKPWHDNSLWHANGSTWSRVRPSKSSSDWISCVHTLKLVRR